MPTAGPAAPASTRSAALSANRALPIPSGPASSQAWWSRPCPARRGRRRPRHRGRGAGSQQILKRGEEARGHLFRRPARIDNPEAVRLCLGEPVEAFGDRAMIVRVAAADQVGLIEVAAVGPPARPPVRGARATACGREGNRGCRNREARGPRRSRARRRRPDRRASCRGSGRRRPIARSRAPAGSSARHGRRGRRRTAVPRPRASSARRGAAGRGSPPRRGCRRARASRRTSRPRARKAAASALTWVDLPTPSPPSSVMKRAASRHADEALQARPRCGRRSPPRRPPSRRPAAWSAAACRRSGRRGRRYAGPGRSAPGPGPDRRSGRVRFWPRPAG